MIVLLSVAASIGVFGFANVPATLIIFEIIPFLVLAVGVDNIFILVHTYQRDPRQPSETHAEHVGRVTGEVAPSMLLSSAAEATCFFLGALTDMPAVRAFALYAGMALLIDFFMQITCFIALISLDTARQENNKWDVLCCKTATKNVHDGDVSDSNGSAMYKLFKYFYAPFLMKKLVRPAVIVIFFGWLCFSLSTVHKIEIGLDQELSMPDDSFVLKYFQHLNKYLSVGPPMYFVVNNTGLKFDFSNITLQKRICGTSECDQYSMMNQIMLWSKQANDTYIASSVQSSWLDDYSSWAKDPQCCKIRQKTNARGKLESKVCQVNPGPTKSNSENWKPKQGEGLRLKRQADTKDDDDPFGIDSDDDWGNDFDDDITYDHKSAVEATTMINSEMMSEELKDGRLPDSFFKNYDEFYIYEDLNSPTPKPQSSRPSNVTSRTHTPTIHRTVTNRCQPEICRRCESAKSSELENHFLSKKDFRSYIKHFLDQDPGEICAISGHAAYIDAIRLVKDKKSGELSKKSESLCDFEQLEEFDVAASSFMTFHTILKTSKDYYEALRWARRLSDNLTTLLNQDLETEDQKINVFPYSIFYVFYEQYLTMWEDTLRSLGISLLAIFIVTYILMGLDARSSLIIVLIIVMILVNLGGLMYWWNITLNAVSLVNLVMAVGISVEFCAHITRAFAGNVGENRTARAKDTLINMGSSVSKEKLNLNIGRYKSWLSEALQCL